MNSIRVIFQGDEGIGQPIFYSLYVLEDHIRKPLLPDLIPKMLRWCKKLCIPAKKFVHREIMKKILACWIGETDLRAAQGEDTGLGPIGQAVTERSFDEIMLLCDYPDIRSTPYIEWLRQRTASPIVVHPVTLSSPTHFGEIYQAALRIVGEAERESKDPTRFTFHLSPGTPAMAAVWIILAKTRFPAELIESSKAHGVQTAAVPFDISAEFIPQVLQRGDQEVERLAGGYPPESSAFDDIIHRSDIMREVIARAHRVALHKVPVLIEGESGTGKEMLASAIHQASPRHARPFVAINCGAIPSELLEAELFGHEKGAFTGAARSRKGHFEEANGGTLFLDEIGELPLSAQVKLLRTLQEGQILKLGVSRPSKLDVRIIAATNRRLNQKVIEGRFREDLFYRLAVAVLELPPLRERTGDLGLLIDHLLERIHKESAFILRGKSKKLSPGARNLLIQHSWPGNVRELMNVLTRAVVWSTKLSLDESDIREALRPAITREASSQGDHLLGRSLDHPIYLPGLISQLTVHYLQRGMEKTGSSKTKTAELLGLPNYQTLTNWLKKHGLD